MLDILFLSGMENLSDYVAYLKRQEPPVILVGRFQPKREIIEMVTRLLQNKYFVFHRISATRKIIGYICERVIGAPICVRFPFCAHERAYMTDVGEISVSRLFLYTSSGHRILKVVLHEVSHWWIAQQDVYDKLLTIEKEYFFSFGKSGEWLLLSPVEYVATILSCELMVVFSEAVEGNASNLLLKMATSEQQRIKTAIDLLCL